MSEIKPKMINGEPICSRSQCPAYGDCEAFAVGDDYICWPWYRAEVARLNQAIKRARNAGSIVDELNRGDVRSLVDEVTAAAARAESAEQQCSILRQKVIRLQAKLAKRESEGSG
jgi:hypothetical protein